MAAVEALWQSESQLALELLDAPATDDPPEVAVVLAMDALADGLGLDLAARRALAARCRDAHGVPRGPADPFAAAYRALARRLADVLTAPELPFVDHRGRVAQVAARLPAAARDALLPALVHLTVVRLVGPDADLEARALTFWERSCESRLARADKGGKGGAKGGARGAKPARRSR
jgi:thiopeptide-type bacteriocin biosynthesis protein